MDERKFSKGAKSYGSKPYNKRNDNGERSENRGNGNRDRNESKGNSNRSEGKSYGNRNENKGYGSRDRNENKGYGNRSEGKGYGNRDRNENKSYGNRSEGKSYGDRNESKGYGSRDRNENKSYGNRSEGKSYGNRSEGKGYGDRDRNESKGYGSRNENKGYGNRSEGKSYGNRSEGKGYGNRDRNESKGYGNRSEGKGYGDRKDSRSNDGKFNKDSRSSYDKRSAQNSYSKNSYNAPAPRPQEDENAEYRIEGRNAVLEALKNGRTIDRILLKKDSLGEGTLRVIAAKAREAGILIAEVGREKLDDLSQTGHHQGVIAICPAYEYSSVEDMLAKAKLANEQPLIILLDGVSDPHNLGAIIRTADAAGAHGVIIPKHRAVGMTATVVRASAGAVEYVPVAKVTNLNQVLDDLKKQGLWIACADMDAQPMYEAPIDGPLALVVGGEGDGVSRLVREKCDFALSIPMSGGVNSLNASVAAAVCMYEVVRRRRG